ncbi:ubiquitin-like small modifier protein 1 [Ferviditalea candida]|uniref:Ubiquitin-like small modifier protein 1 n=1 Tax=Ferviditalea candida TaxID=3108399 RepID=A0ABU5ZFT5_9BACL|nr:ubiquitin-like small modifier protein 1 [Paenibacillaceae bacterium T2]
MQVKVFASFREIVLDKSVEVPFRENMTVRDLIDAIILSHPLFAEEIYTENRELKPHVQIFINGKSIRHAMGLETKFGPEDEIAMFPPVAGG